MVKKSMNLKVLKKRGKIFRNLKFVKNRGGQNSEKAREKIRKRKFYFF